MTLDVSAIRHFEEKMDESEKKVKQTTPMTAKDFKGRSNRNTYRLLREGLL